jgi:hypothetical protein
MGCYFLEYSPSVISVIAVGHLSKEILGAVALSTVVRLSPLAFAIHLVVSTVMLSDLLQQ